jgi:DNA-binding transcriptional MerR regulator
VYRIGDFARLGRISVRALRYYDEIGLMKPVEVDNFTGYRYYSAGQLPRLHYISALKEAGLSLEEIAILTGTKVTRHEMRRMLFLKEGELEQRLIIEKRRLEHLKRLLT